MKKYIVLLFVLSVLLVSCSKPEAVNKFETLNTPEKLEDKFSYSMGTSLAEYCSYYRIEGEQLDYFMRGIYDKIQGNDLFTDEEKQQFFMEYTENMLNTMKTENLEEAEAFLAENRKADGVVETDSGLQYKVITEGTGERATAESTVNVYYKLSKTDGTEIQVVDAENGGPISFGVNQLVPGVTEGLCLMNAGSKYVFWIHPSLGYGENGSGAIEPNQLLVFEFELISIE